MYSAALPTFNYKRDTLAAPETASAIAKVKALHVSQRPPEYVYARIRRRLAAYSDFSPGILI